MNTERTNQSRQAANAAFEQWWQRHGLEDPMDNEDRYYITASSWARRGYLAAMQAQQAEPVAWEYREFHDDNTVTPGWGKWKRIESEDWAGRAIKSVVADIHEFIAQGYRYEIRELYAQPPAVAEGCGACGDGCKGQGCRLERESPPVVAEPVAHPCWSCGRLVTAERRAAADGDCPNCGAELDQEDWPATAQKGGAPC